MLGGLSARDAVLSSSNRGNSDSGVKGYYVQKVGNVDKLETHTVPKGKGLSIIAEEAHKRASMPSPLTYKLHGENKWDYDSSVNKTGKLMDRAKRITEPMRVEMRNKKPETSTPSP